MCIPTLRFSGLKLTRGPIKLEESGPGKGRSHARSAAFGCVRGSLSAAVCLVHGPRMCYARIGERRPLCLVLLEDDLPDGLFSQPVLKWISVRSSGFREIELCSRFITRQKTRLWPPSLPVHHLSPFLCILTANDSVPRFSDCAVDSFDRSIELNSGRKVRRAAFPSVIKLDEVLPVCLVQQFSDTSAVYRENEGFS